MFGTRQSVVLSPRQRQILTLLRDGKANKEIAHELNIGIGTVKQHMVSLFKKMGVSNRAMAISKSFSIDGLSIDGPVPLDAMEAPPTAFSTAIERRPCAVLSLELTSKLTDDGNELHRDLYRVFAETAFDFGAVFLSHMGGRCDMIFGIRKVRRHDVLRAIRAAKAVAQALQSLTPETNEIQAGLAFGYIYASTDRQGEWTGEAIGGKAISVARDMIRAGRPSAVALHRSVLNVIKDLRLDTAAGIPWVVPLDGDFQWRRVMPDRAITCGLRTETDILRHHLRDLRNGGSHTVLIEGESGMGKTTLAGQFMHYAQRDGFEAETWICAIPDSQPGSASLGRIEREGSDELLDVDSFAKHIQSSPNKVWIIEDCHLLPRENFFQLAKHASDTPSSPRLVAMTYRGRAPNTGIDSVEKLRLAHMTPETADEILLNLLGRNHPAGNWVKDLAQGVPGFLARLATSVHDAVNWSKHGPGAVPPVDMFALVAERIEAHNLDRRLLHAVASAPVARDVETLQQDWPDTNEMLDTEIKRAVASGVLRQRPGRRGKPGDLEISHPLVKWVAVSAFLPENSAFD